MAEKSGLPTIAAMKGVNRSAVSAVTTPPKAAPITTPTAISTTLPRRINCLKPDSIWKNPPSQTGRLPLGCGARQLGRLGKKRYCAPFAIDKRSASDLDYE